MYSVFNKLQELLTVKYNYFDANSELWLSLIMQSSSSSGSHHLDYDDPVSIRALLTRCGLRPPSRIEPNIDCEKQMALQELQQRHDSEIESLFSFLEIELSKVGKSYSHKIASLHDQIEDSSVEIKVLKDKLGKMHSENVILRDRLDKSLVVAIQTQDKMRQFEQDASYELQAASSEVKSSGHRVCALENEVIYLRRKLKDQEEEMVKKRRQYLLEIEWKNKEISSLKQNSLSVEDKSNLILANKNDAVEMMDKSIVIDVSMEIQKLKSESIASVKKLYLQDAFSTINLDSSKKWEDDSDLTNENDFGLLRYKETRSVRVKGQRKSAPPVIDIPLSTRSNKMMNSPMNLLGEEISLSYSNSNDDDEKNPKSSPINLWSGALQKDVDNSLSKRLERMYCTK